LNRVQSVASSQQHRSFMLTRDVACRGHASRAADQPGTTASALLRPPVPRAPHGTRRGIGRSPRRPASHVTAVRLVLSTTSPAHTLTLVADVRNGRDFSPTARAHIKAEELADVRTQDLDVQRHRGSPLRPHGELRCQPCFPATQTSRHLR
jgi:hypothetical protein